MALMGNFWHKNHYILVISFYMGPNLKAFVYFFYSFILKDLSSIYYVLDTVTQHWEYTDDSNVVPILGSTWSNEKKTGK